MIRRSAQYGWQEAAAWLGLLFVLGGTVYRDTLLHVIAAWNEWRNGEYYAHGYLTLLISLFLVFRQRRTLAALAPCPDAVALPVLAVSALLWLSGHLVDVLMVQVAALLLLLWTLLWAVLGAPVARRLFMPVFILVFAVPVWSMLPELLQQLTAHSAYFMARLLGVPALLHEQFIILPDGKLAIEQSCSGLSYLLAALTLGTLYGCLNRNTAAARALVIAIAGITAILANILRVLIVVYIAWRTNMQHEIIRDHFNLGWYLFGAIVLVLLVIDSVLLRRSGAMRNKPPVGTGLPVTGCTRSPLMNRLVPLLAGAILAAGPLLGWQADRRVQAESQRVVVMPEGKGGWQGPFPAADDWRPVFHGAATQLSGYRRDGSVVLVFTGFYPYQTQGRELIYDWNSLAGDTVWHQDELAAPERRVDGRAVLELQLYTPDGRHRLVWYWYRVSGHDTTSRFLAKVWQLPGLLLGRPQAGVVALAADYGKSADTARMQLRSFARQMGTELSRSLDGRISEQEAVIR